MFRLGVLLVPILLLHPCLAGEKDKKPKLPFTISKETTFITGPLTKEGWLDYNTAVNERLRQGVTPENNASALLAVAIGPRPEGARLSPRFYKLLGIQEPAAKGEYYQDLFKFARDKLKIDTTVKGAELIEQEDEASSKPWEGTRYPVVAQYLKANENALNLASEAVMRSRYYYPLVPSNEDQGLISALLPSVQKCRMLCRTFMARAMLHLGEGRPTEAWQDLLAVHRLGRAVGRGGTLIEGLVGIAIDNIATHGTLCFLEDARLDAKMVKDCLRDLQALPPAAGMLHQVNLVERFLVLQSIQRVSRPDKDAFQELTDISKFGDVEITDELLKKADWNGVFKQANIAFDRLIAAVSTKDNAERHKKMAQFIAEMQELKKNLNSEEAAKAMQSETATPAERGKVLGDALLAMLMPSIAKVQAAGERGEQIQRNLHVAYALAAYQLENGSYPKKLADLAPKYLAVVPGDVFSGKDLIYRVSKEGVLVYSVGTNGVDEGGRYYDDEPAGDDPNVRLPRRRK